MNDVIVEEVKVEEKVEVKVESDGSRQKLLDDLKKTQAQNRAFQERFDAIDKEKADAELEQQVKAGEFGKVRASLEEELKAKDERIQKFEQEKTDAVKRDGFVKELNSRDLTLAGDSVWSMIDLSDIAVEEGAVNSLTVKGVVDKLHKDSPFIFEPTKTEGKVTERSHTTGDRAKSATDLKAELVERLCKPEQ